MSTNKPIYVNTVFIKVMENLIKKLSTDEMFLFYFDGERGARHNTSLNRIPHSSAIPNPICWQICALQFVFTSAFSTFVCTQPRFQGFTKCVCLCTQCHSHLKRFLLPPPSPCSCLFFNLYNKCSKICKNMLQSFKKGDFFYHRPWYKVQTTDKIN